MYEVPVLPRAVLDHASQIGHAELTQRFAELRQIKQALWHAILDYHVYAPVFLIRAMAHDPWLGKEIEARTGPYLEACRQIRTGHRPAEVLQPELAELVRWFMTEADPDHKILRRWVKAIADLDKGVVSIELAAAMQETRTYVRKTPRFAKYVSDLMRLNRDYDRLHHRLVVANLRLVNGCVRRMLYRFTSPEDLGSEATIGIMIAVHRFQPELGHKFSTYAVHWIRSMVVRKQQCDDLVRIPVHMQEKSYRIDSVRRRYCAENGSEPTTEELLAIVNRGRPDRNVIREHEIALLDRRASSLLSLDKQVGEFGDLSLIDVVPDDHEALERQYEIRDLHVIVEEILATLSPAESDAFRFVSGMMENDPTTGPEKLTLATIGLRHHVCRERIRQLALEAAEKIRRELRRRKLVRSARHALTGRDQARARASRSAGRPRSWRPTDPPG